MSRFFSVVTPVIISILVQLPIRLAEAVVVVEVAAAEVVANRISNDQRGMFLFRTDHNRSLEH